MISYKCPVFYLRHSNFMAQTSSYTEENIKSLDWKEHIRMRPGMYIGKLGDGSAFDDGIYILLKEVIDNSIDEFVMGAGKTIEINIKENIVNVRDYGRGIPLGKVVDVVSKMNTGGKYDTRAFKKSVGLNGVGTKAVNALSSSFEVQSIRDGKLKKVSFEYGEISSDSPIEESNKRKGTKVIFKPDSEIFKNFKYRSEYVVRMLKYYVYLNPGLTIVFNGEKLKSENGLKDLIEDNNNLEDFLYPVIHLKGKDIEIALTHNKKQYSEEYYSFVNGQHTTQGGTHLSALKESIVKTIRDHFKKPYDSSDIRKSVLCSSLISLIESFPNNLTTSFNDISSKPAILLKRFFDFSLKLGSISLVKISITVSLLIRKSFGSAVSSTLPIGHI